MPVKGGAAKNITADNRGYDGSAQFSPNGRFIAYRSQTTPGFEADRFRLMLYDRKTGKAQSITESLDSNVDEFTFAPIVRTIIPARKIAAAARSTQFRRAVVQSRNLLPRAAPTRMFMSLPMARLSCSRAAA